MSDSIMPIYREATSADLPAICVLGQVVNLLHHEAWPQLFSPASDPQRDDEYWQKSIGNISSTIFVAETSGEIVGFVTVRIVITENETILQPMRFARVESICVAMAFRGQGIGRELMSRAEHWAINNDAVDIRLSVWVFNQPALRLYEELGYEVRSQSLGKALTKN
ncbi:GNAT family N-acetyltransferase [Sulfuriferula nivalis]|uniref:N-acetyltransferase n=1 Tax=Sulfuriferula nivalis TaxID=2675298 RepID=A0A809S8C9_9PROT|nr:GNAT family N-acetyltransferase [Sulfuriferula nivalis]BBP00132.1 N-acetyltransferase [Sulfuriferula nivalis]